MPSVYRHIRFEQHGNAACVQLVKVRLEETEIYQTFTELYHLASEYGCPRIAFVLGPETPHCMYSIFLAKLIALDRRLQELGGALKLCSCQTELLDILDACLLRERFDIVPDAAAALRDWGLLPNQI